jgi:predicted metal-dependent phosphoesterase TrpH
MNNTNRIQFEKPDLEGLRSRYTVVDMHFHSHYSDGNNSVDQIADRAKELGIGIAVTDHNAIQGALELNAYKNLLTIPGIEVTSLEGTHLLVYFYEISGLKKFFTRDIEPYMGTEVMSSIALPMEKIVDCARRYHSLIICPHPYSAAYTGVYNSYFPVERLNTIFGMIDGVEAINAANLNRWNLRCAVLGFNLGKSVTGGSDGHALSHMGRAVSYAKTLKSRRAFLDAVKMKRNKVVGKEFHFLKKVTANGMKLKSNIRNYPDLMEKNIRYSYTYFNNKSRSLKDNVKRSLNGKLRKIARG